MSGLSQAITIIEIRLKKMKEKYEDNQTDYPSLPVRMDEIDKILYILKSIYNDRKDPNYIDQCSKCGCADWFIMYRDISHNKIGQYCKKCGKWLKWVSKDCFSEEELANIDNYDEKLIEELKAYKNKCEEN